MKKHSDESNAGLVTCIRLSKETRNRLAQLGSKGQTFDDIVNATIDQSLQKKQMSDESEEKFS